MKRRNFLGAMATVTVAATAGCMGGPDSDESGRDVEGSENAYDYDITPENFDLYDTHISRNLPDKVGVTIGIISKQQERELVPLEVSIFDANGNKVFYEPEFFIPIDGGVENQEKHATCWFEATEEELKKRLFPRVRIRENPP